MSEPDWTVIGGGIATAAMAFTALWAGMNGKFKERKTEQKSEKNEQEELRTTRDRDATANTALTLENVWKLVNELQEERKGLRDSFTASEARCTNRIISLEEEVRVLKRTIANLEADVRAVRKPP